MWILYPSWPLLSGYFGGLIGGDQRLEFEQRLEKARADQAVYLDQIRDSTPTEISEKQDLLTFAVLGGEAAFGTNCAPCHGLGGAGQLHYPSLADDAWIWGGTMDEIEYTIRHGIRNDTDQAHTNFMPPYGDMLSREEIAQTVAYVLSLGGQEEDPEAVEAGAVLFEENCAACHGEDGKGLVELGAPNLTDFDLALWR